MELQASFPLPLPDASSIQGRYSLRLARSEGDLDAVLRLRYEVFNLELGEGLDASRATGRDQDEFDLACDHLMVEDVNDGRVVGTYRMQTSEVAARGRGFYSAGEFDLSLLPQKVITYSEALWPRSHKPKGERQPHCSSPITRVTRYN